MHADRRMLAPLACAASLFAGQAAAAELILPAPALTQIAVPAGAHSGSQDVKTQTINISPAQAARAARNVYGGKVLAVILEDNAKAPYYRVKLLSGGQVRVVRVAAHR